MLVSKNETLKVQAEEDVVRVRQMVRKWAAELKFSLIQQTKVVTAASEIGRNTLVYGGGGSVELEVLTNSARSGLRLTFSDQGPGIADVELALRDGYTTGNGLGLGLGGARRLVNEFEIQSRSGKGTRITMVAWQ